MKILDATCGSKSIWYQPHHPFVIFMDKRKENYKDPRVDRYFVHRVDPDVVSEWKNTPFPNGHFDMVVFDPPHIIRDRNKKEIHLTKKYGELNKDNWKQVIKEGVKKLFDVLKDEGIFIFKWNDRDKSLGEVLSLFPYRPMFGTKTGTSNHTHWVLFLKYSVNMKLEVN